MMRWPWTRPFADEQEAEQDRQLEQAAQFRRRAEHLADDLQAWADRLERTLEEQSARRNGYNGRPSSGPRET